jgi:hypothetical protein
VSTDFDPATDFAQYRSYTWKAQEEGGDEARGVSPLMDERIRAAVDRELAAKGLNRVEENGDLRVGYAVVSAPSRVRSSPSAHFGVGSYGGSGGVSVGIGVPIGGASTYEEGTLILDLVDARTEQLLWRGSVTRRIVPRGDPEDTDRRVAEVVQELLEKFPPP